MLKPNRIVLLHIAIGALLGVILIHPITMAIYWFEFHPLVPIEGTLWDLIVRRLSMAFSPSMLPMTGLFATIGGALGLGSGLYYRALLGKASIVNLLEDTLARDIPTLIRRGESDTLEFKSSARWDRIRERKNSDLESAIIKTIAGFLNHRGGDLLIGVGDDGAITGLEADYATLKRKNRDGFEQFILALVGSRLGRDICVSVSVVFQDCGGLDVCRLVAVPLSRPVYCADGGVSHFYLRTGNATVELDVQEAFSYIRSHWQRA